jgi:hypothetical protein
MMNLNKIHLKFEHPLLHNIKQIYLRPNNKVEYTNLSYLTYYTEIYNSKLTISFSALFKDSYLVILIDTIDKELNNSVSHKNIIFIKADWSLIKINNELFLHELNIINKKKYKYFYLPLRKYFDANNDLSIEDILLIHDCVHYDLIITKKEEKEIKKVIPQQNNEMKDIHQQNSMNQTISNIKNKIHNKFHDKFQNKIKDFVSLFNDE